MAKQWFRNLVHMCLHFLSFALQVINHLSLKMFRVCAAETLELNLRLYEWTFTNILVRICLESTWSALKSCFLFFLLGGFCGLACGATMEKNHNPCSERTGLAWINIDGNLACFLCLQCFREFYCSSVSLLRQYVLWTKNNNARLCSSTGIGGASCGCWPWL